MATLPRAAAPATVRVTAKRRAVLIVVLISVSPWRGGPVPCSSQVGGPTARLPRARRKKSARIEGAVRSEPAAGGGDDDAADAADLGDQRLGLGLQLAGGQVAHLGERLDDAGLRGGELAGDLGPQESGDLTELGRGLDQRSTLLGGLRDLRVELLLVLVGAHLGRLDGLAVLADDDLG